jgi:hypothetical protein
MPAFIAGTVLGELVRDLDLELVPGSFDGAEDWAAFDVVGKGGTRARVRVDVVTEFDDLDR